MNKCEMCQQICNNLTKVYNRRIKTLAEIILKLKGFEACLEVNNAFSICGNCKQGLKNVANLWEHIPEAKQNFSNGATTLQEIYETSPSSNLQEEVVAYNTANLPSIEVKSKCPKDDEPKKPIKLKIKRLKEETNSYTLVSLNSTEECSSKRLRRPPKRYNDFNVDLPSKQANVLKNHRKIKESSWNKLPPMATIRSANGMNLGNLFEVEKNGKKSRMRIICEMCSSAFAYEKEFQMHMEVHKTNEDFEAVETFSHKGYLFHCKLCEKSFKEHYAVRRHYKFAHSEERSFKCDHCGVSFKYKFNFDYHMAKHISKKRFECSYCKKAFVLRYELKIHLRTHTKERPYKCDFCPYTFAHSSNLKAHKKVKHSKNSSGFNTSRNTIIVEGKNQSEANFAESNSDFKNNVNEVKHMENISTTDESNNEENFNLSAVKYKPKEPILLDSVCANSLSENSKSSSSKTKYKSEEIKNPFLYKPVNKVNKSVVRSITNMADNFIYDYRKQITCCSSLYPFKIANTALRTIPQSSLLTIKKWPKSYQRAITENPVHKDGENKSTIFEYEMSRQINENSMTHLNKLEAEGSFSERHELTNEIHSIDMEHSTILDFKNMNIDKSEWDINQSHNKINTTTIENTVDSNISTLCAIISSESFNKTQQNKESLYSKIELDSEFANKSQINMELSSLSCSNMKNVENIDVINNLKLNSNITPTKSGKLCSYLEDSQKPGKSETTNYSGKCSKFSPIVIDPNFSGEIKIIKVSNKIKKETNFMQLLNISNKNTTTELITNEPLKVYNKSRIKPKTKSQNVTEIKVSAKPVKILKLNHSKTSDSILKTSSQKYLTKNNNFKQTCVLKSDNKNHFNSNISLISPAFNGTENQITETAKNSIAKSLLKTKITPLEKYNLNTKLNTNSLIKNFSNKPLITKVEILPSLIISPSLQKSLSSSQLNSTQTHVQPPKEYKHQCPYCLKYFKQKSPLNKHLRTHTGEKPYKCNLCPKSYADASNYKKHKMLHKNAAEALNISNSTTAHLMQNSPAYSTVSDPDPDGIEVMQTIKKFERSPLDENDDMYDDDDGNASLSSSTTESYMWQDALDHALSNDDIRENIKRNLVSFNNAIMPSNIEQQLTKNDYSNTKSLSCEDPD